VDHNKPEKILLPYYKSIIEVIDHHKKSYEYDVDIPITIEKTGSCSTLIGEQFLKQSKKKINIDLAGLLYTTIKIDVDHLTNNPQYDLYKDKEILAKLFPYCQISDLFVREINIRKYNTGHFSLHDHLVKDFKHWFYDEICYGISTIHLDIKDFLEITNNSKNIIQNFISERNLDILFMMHLTKEPILKRELTIIFNDTFFYRKKLIQLIEISNY
jgi:inorganic pyrophosphatase/exopolyphosphatase